MHNDPDIMQSSSQGDGAGAALMNLSAIIGRIEETVEAETASIRTDIRFDIKASNARKSRYLYELNKAMSGLGTALRWARSTAAPRPDMALLSS